MPTLKTDLKKKTFSCFLKILSPVHIGCDEVYEPMNFVVDETARELIIFDPFAFFAGMDAEDREKFTQICRKGTVSSILEIYKFLRRKKAEGRRVPICSDFLSHYNQTMGIKVEDEEKIQQELNRFAIQRTAFHPHTGLAYIPGSSLKGALRTAWVNGLAKSKKTIKTQSHKRLEEYLLDTDREKNSIESDPFRLVKVSDFMPVKNVETRIVYAVNEKKKLSKFEAGGPYQILEIICPGAVFAGEITVEEKHKDAPIQSPVSAEKFLPAADKFYIGEKKREDEELRTIGVNGSPQFSADKLALVRIGRHCGAESLTIEGYRSIKILRNPKEQDHATTLWLASEQRKYTGKQNLRPFGWTELLDANAENEKVRRAEEAAAAEARKQAEAAEAEARKQAAFAAMSREDQAIAQIRDSAVPEQKVTEIFNGLDNFSPDRKTDLAAAFKERWMKENGKWGKKKECSKKQWEKVSRIKEILGE